MLSKASRVILSNAKNPALGLGKRHCEILPVVRMTPSLRICFWGHHLYYCLYFWSAAVAKRVLRLIMNYDFFHFVSLIITVYPDSYAQ